MLSREYGEFFESTCLEEQLQTAASVTGPTCLPSTSQISCEDPYDLDEKDLSNGPKKDSNLEGVISIDPKFTTLLR